MILRIFTDKSFVLLMLGKKKKTEKKKEIKKKKEKKRKTRKEKEKKKERKPMMSNRKISLLIQISRSIRPHRPLKRMRKK